MHAILVEEPELRIARMNTSVVEGRLSYWDFHYLICTPQGVTHFVERRELGLSSPKFPPFVRANTLAWRKQRHFGTMDRSR